MKKPASLRAAVTEALPALQRDPDKLLVFIEDGSIISTGAPTLSFQYAYTLNLIVLDYAEHADNIIVPINAWLRKNQPEMLLNPDLMRDGFKFEAELLNHTTMDLSIKLKLTERVGVKEVAETGERIITHFDEPPIVGGIEL